MKNKIEDKITEIDLLQSDVLRMGKLKVEMYKKIEDLSKCVISQNAQIVNISKRIDDMSLF